MNPPTAATERPQAETAESAGRGPQADKLLEMMQQRALLLQEAVDLAVIRYRQGESRYDVVLSLQRDLLDAELQLATNREQRIAVYRRLVDNMTTAEKVARQLYEAKEVSQIDYLRAKAARLQAQIDLEKAMRQ